MHNDYSNRLSAKVRLVDCAFATCVLPLIILGLFAWPLLLLAADVSIARPTSSSQPTTADDGINRGLIKSLVRPYWREPAHEWESFVMSFFDVAGRDLKMSQIGRLVANHPDRQRLRVLILENIEGDKYPKYYCSGLYCRRGQSDDPITQLRDLQLAQVDEQRWKLVEAALTGLMKIGGRSVANIARTFDDSDSTVVSYFDGDKWRIETWFLLAALGELEEPETKAYVRLLETIIDKFPADQPVGGDRYRDLLLKLGDPEKVLPVYGDKQKASNNWLGPPSPGAPAKPSR